MTDTQAPPTSLITDTTTASFQVDVIERSKQVPVLVDFWAAWCGPCRVLTPQIERVVGDADGAVALAKVNVDAEQQLAQRFQISGIPHVKLFSGGREVDHFVGVRPAGQIETFLAGHVGPSEFERLTEQYRDAGTFPDAVSAFELGYNEQAFDHLLRDVTQLTGQDKLHAREYMVAAFRHLGADTPVVARYRKLLASALY